MVTKPLALMASLLTSSRLPGQLWEIMSKSITPKEIKPIMFKINGDKAPDPNGFTVHLFKVA